MTNKFFSLRKESAERPTTAEPQSQASRVPYAADLTTFAPPGAEHFHTSHPKDRYPTDVKTDDDLKRYNQTSLSKTLNVPISHYKITPRQAYISMYGGNRALGERMYAQARNKRIAAILRHLPNTLTAEEKAQGVLGDVEDNLRNNHDALPPVWASFMTPNDEHLAPYLLGNKSSQPIGVSVIRDTFKRPTSVKRGEQSMFLTMPKSPKANAQIILGDYANTEEDKNTASILRGIGSLSRNYGHEIMHPLTLPIDVGNVDAVVADDPHIQYTSSRKGYGNLNVEALGGLGQLKAFFGRNFNYVPETFDAALADLESRGMISRDPNTPYNEYRFTDKFGDRFTNGVSTTLDDTFTNLGYQDMVDKKSPHIDSAGASKNTVKERTEPSIYSKYRELWDLTKTRRKVKDRRMA